MNKHYGTVVAAAMLFAATGRAQTVRYVDKNATGPTHDGTSWCSAFLELRDALALPQNDVVIRVAEATYKPTTGTSRTETFRLLDGVAVYGGYAGCDDPQAARDGDL